ncbi:MAG: hypothetical protein LBD70_08955, partial [Bifidobacteriaceae bacterium]|nr:hypothetical protein [Bifidobacteriaceae bacterium]
MKDRGAALAGGLALTLEALACPVCLQSLAVSDAAPGALVCGARHTFNLARAGYCSFAVGGAARHLSDTPAMVAARADFLASGHYRLIADAVAAAVAAGLGDQPAAGPEPAGGGQARPLILDLAGGTGYYLAAALDAAPDARGLVVDLSRAAAKRAAACHPRAGALVADVWGRLPLR